MVACITRSIENRQPSFLSDGVFGNDPLLLRLVLDSCLNKPNCRGKTAGDDVLDALSGAQVEGWEW